MNEKHLYTLKEIAEELGINYKTLLSCKDRFNDFVYGVPFGRVARYSEDFVDFFKLVFALFDEGYSTERIRNLLFNGARSEEDSFIEPWLETWRAKLCIISVGSGMSQSNKAQADRQDDKLTDGRTGALTDPLPESLTGWRTDGLTDGQAAFPTCGPADSLTDGRTNALTDGRTDSLAHGPTDGQADMMTEEAADTPSASAGGTQTIPVDPSPCQNINVAEQLCSFAENLNQVLSETLTAILQKLATENNIAITAICEAIEDIQSGIQAVDARLSALEDELGIETEDLAEMYRIKAEDFQVSLPAPEFDFRVLPDDITKMEEPPQTDNEHPEDPHKLAAVQDSISDGKPDRDTLLQWILSQRNTTPRTSYKNLAAILNDAKIPTLSGRDFWSRGTIRNMAVKAENDTNHQ